MRVLVLADDYWHPGSVVREGLAPLAEKGYVFDWIEDGTEWTADRMADYPVVILSKSNNVTQADKTPWVTPEVERAFVDYVRGGGGLLATHSGTVYIVTETMRPLLGGTFIEHPPACAVTVSPASGDPLLTGVTSFTAEDEHYQMQMEDGVDDVFLTSTSEHGTQPAGWTRSEGDGRVCVLTPGHNAEVWLTPSYQVLLDNALRWCAGEA